MTNLAVGSAFALVVAALCLGGRSADAQSAPLRYWTPGWLGFGGNLYAGQDANVNGSLAGLGGSDTGSAPTRFDFPSGWFVGSDRGGSALRVDQAGTFGSFTSEGVQFGYNFRNAPVTFHAGFDTLRYNSGLGSAFSLFDAVSGTAGYSVNAGVEFKPTSNLSLSLGFGYIQQSGRIDSDTSSPAMPNDSQFDMVRSRR